MAENKECVRNGQFVCPHPEVTGDLCSACKVIDQDGRNRECGCNPSNFDCVCDWVKKNPGTNNYSCSWCGIYTASKPRCSDCQCETLGPVEALQRMIDVFDNPLERLKMKNNEFKVDTMRRIRATLEQLRQADHSVVTLLKENADFRKRIADLEKENKELQRQLEEIQI
jgi:predicted  nucleic acid-binding Zn ribbon protein